ncbi:hypothetical protein DMA11_09680 [Marinilabiliaceae bacterium JC017]|nr:hypothetical protein DMA11_09680 [Marinilabiliaceae bacterium JC017]
MKYQHLLLLPLLVLCISLKAQYYHFSQYSLEEGLSQSEVLAIEEDQYGYLWIGTNGGGLCRFNGRSFDVFTRNDGLIDNIVIDLYQDNNYNMWIGSPRGISKYDGTSYKQILKTDTAAFRDEIVFCEGSNEVIWALARLSTRGRVLYRIERDSVVNAIDYFPELSAEDHIYYITPIHHKQVLITTNKGIFLLKDDKLVKTDIWYQGDDGYNIQLPLFSDRTKNLWLLLYGRELPRKLVKYNLTNKTYQEVQLPKDIDVGRILEAYEDREGGIWLSVADKGVLFLSDGEWRIFNKTNGLPINYIREVHEDAEGNFWLGSLGAGLFRYSGDLFVSFDKQAGLTDDLIRSIYQDSDGNYYFADADGGLNIFNGEKITPIPHDKMAGVGPVREFYETQPGRLLTATLNGLFEYDGKRFHNVTGKYGIKQQLAFSDIAMEKDTFYFGSYAAGLFVSAKGKAESFNTHNSDITSNVINNVFIDSKARIWLSTDNGISLYENGKFVNYTEKNGLNASWILQAAEDKVGNIWFATFTGGLLRFDGNTFKVFDTDVGVTSDNIYSVIADQEGDIWAGTQNGVDKLTIETNGEVTSIVNYDRYDGFVGIENNSACNFMDQNGKLWFGTIKGVMCYNPAEKRTNFLPPPVYIRNIEIGFKDPDWAKEPFVQYYDSLSSWFGLPGELRLPHNKNHVSFQFDGLCYSVPEKVKYRWKLEPIEQDWLPANSYNKAVYASLPPGKYTFRVIARNNSGIWNEEGASYAFEIVPTWWQSGWMKSIIPLLFLGSLFFLIRAWRSRTRRFNYELETVVAAKTVEIRKQKSEIEQKNSMLESQKTQIEKQAHSITSALNDLEKLTTIGKLVTANLSTERIFNLLYQHVSEVMDTNLFAIGIFNEEKSTLEFQNIILNEERMPFTTFPLDDKERLSIFCFRNDQEVFINDFENEYTKYVREMRPVPGDINSRSLIYVTLKVGDKPFGVLSVQSAEKGAYSEYHLNFLRNIANYAGIAIENAEAFEQLAKQRSSLELAHASILTQKGEIENKNKRLEELNDENSKLLALITNELQNPMTSSLSLVNSLLSAMPFLNKEQQDALQHIHAALWQINDMVNQVDEITRLESGCFTIQTQKVEAVSLLREVVAQHEELFKKKALSVQWNTEPVELNCDPVLLEKVTSNLISNAIKFSPRESIITIRVTGDQKMCRVEVADQGPGMTKADKARLFKKFQKLSAAPTGKEVSAGLGLYIVKKYIDLLHGTIWVESEPGQGAVFIFKLPVT